MATQLNVTEFSDISLDSYNREVPVGDLSKVVAHVSYSISSTGVTTISLNQKTRFVRLKARTADAYFSCTASAPTSTEGVEIEADVAEYFGVQPKGTTGESLYVLGASTS